MEVGAAALLACLVALFVAGIMYGKRQAIAAKLASGMRIIKDTFARQGDGQNDMDGSGG